MQNANYNHQRIEGLSTAILSRLEELIKPQITRFRSVIFTSVLTNCYLIGDSFAILVVRFDIASSW